jgi:hypothetical protein
VRLSIASRTMAMTSSGCSSIMVQVNRNTHQPSKTRRFAAVGSGVIQTAIDLNDQLEAAKHHIDIDRQAAQNNWPVCLPSGDAGVSQQAMEEALRFRPRFGPRFQ